VYIYNAAVPSYTISPLVSLDVTSDAGHVSYTAYAYATDTSVVFTIYAPPYGGNENYSSSLSLTFKYYLLQESAI
jgi:hypothetical protein